MRRFLAWLFRRKPQKPVAVVIHCIHGLPMARGTSCDGCLEKLMNETIKEASGGFHTE